MLFTFFKLYGRYHIVQRTTIFSEWTFLHHWKLATHRKKVCHFWLKCSSSCLEVTCNQSNSFNDISIVKYINHTIYTNFTIGKTFKKESVMIVAACFVAHTVPLLRDNILQVEPWIDRLNPLLWSPNLKWKRTLLML